MTSTGQFEIIGLPAPQGSKSAVMIGGKARLIEGKGSAGRNRHKDWRTTVASVARDVADTTPEAPLDGPLHLDVIFRFPMPASRKKADLARGWAWKTSAPDLDKLVRTLGDGLTAGGLIRDDARFAIVTAEKREVTGWTGALVIIKTIDPSDMAA